METAKGREIKFRAWNGIEMLYNGFHISAPGIAWTWTDFTATDSEQIDYPIMQYTGLIDKNGVEIYEGDVLINPEGKVGIVVWYEGGFYLRCDRKSGQPFFVALTNGFVANKLQIGNLYTNPELLNQ